MRRGRTASSLRRALLVLPIWAITSWWMWLWWLQVKQTGSPVLYAILTLALLYEFLFLPSVFLFLIIKAKAPGRRIATKNLKVAVISPCVPSLESLDIVEKQLQAMQAIIYPHDSWILDEGNNQQIKILARKYGVKYFSRKGIKKYNQKTAPFQKRTKAGNINAWLEHVKRRRYDYFVQLDIDHIPKPNYLNKTLGYFRDSEVAWVQAPSIYSNRSSWTARGAAEQELVLQGPMQMGFYGSTNTPFIIGSHCTYRMSAIREIGGFQPTRAEDHLDTVVLSSRGYKGVFLPEIIAEGDGPETLRVYLAQQFAWAYSMFQVLLYHTPKLLKKLPLRRKMLFLFSQTWYPLWSLSYAVLFLMPLIALITNREIVTIGRWDMFIHFGPVFAAGFIIWLSAKPIMQPEKLMISWRGIILHAVRWPIILHALLCALFKISKPYMITPKGSHAKQAPLMATYRPFLVMAIVSLATILYATLRNEALRPQAQMVFALSNAGFMLTICILDLAIAYKKDAPKKGVFVRYWLRPFSAVSATAVLLLLTTLSSAIIIPQQSNASLGIKLQAISPQSASYSMSTEELIKYMSSLPKISEEPDIGIYQPGAKNLPSKRPYIQHSFSDWDDTHYIAYTLAKTLESGNTPLITLEPRSEEDGAKLLEDISAGKYSDRFNNMTDIFKASPSNVYLRFAHEMELEQLYGWGAQEPSLYISAYQTFFDSLKENGANNVKSVWSPAGNYGAERYYPGDEYVDVIGTTILHDSYWYGEYQPSFAELSMPREWLQQFGKPLWIVEFGVGSQNQTLQKNIIDQAIREYKNLGYEKILYINMKDSNIEGPDYRLKDPSNFSDQFTVIKKIPTKNEGPAVTKKPEPQENPVPKKPHNPSTQLTHLKEALSF